MSEFSEWCDLQLRRAGHSPDAGGAEQSIYTSVMVVCGMFGEMRFTPETEQMRSVVVELITELLHRRALPPNEPNKLWVPSRQLVPGVGARVRVPPNAFEGHDGQLLNGREADVVGTRHGQFMIHFVDGREPADARVLAANLETVVERSVEYLQ